MSIIVAERINLVDLVKRTFRSKFTREMITQERKTPLITDDPDTICFMKYLLHNKVKSRVFDDFKYEEMLGFSQVNSVQNSLPKKVNVLKQVHEKELAEQERLRIEKDIVREAFDA